MMQTMLAPRKEDVIAILRAHEAEIRSLGIDRLALFGSTAAGQARAESDVDVLVEFRTGTKTYDRFLALGDLLEKLLGHRVEIVTRESLSPHLGPHILATAFDVLVPA